MKACGVPWARGYTAAVSRPSGKAWVSTEEVCATVEKTRKTILRWARLGLLPPFEVVYARGKSVRWPAHAPEQARWVDSQLRAGFTFDEIKSALERGDFTASDTQK